MKRKPAGGTGAAEQATELVSGATAGVDELLARIRRHVPFENYIVTGLPFAGRGVGTGTILADSWPRDFRAQYLGQAWFKRCAVVRLLRTGGMVTTAAAAAAAERDRVMLLRHRACSEVLGRELVAVPVHAMGKLTGSVTFVRNEPFSPAETELAGMVAAAVHAAATGLPTAAPVPLLTARLRECLAWVGAGKTSAEVAAILGLSEHTVISHLNEAMRRLGATSRAHAVALALRHGLIE